MYDKIINDNFVPLIDDKKIKKEETPLEFQPIIKEKAIRNTHIRIAPNYSYREIKDK